MAIKTFNLPDPGEGLVEAEIVEWKVSPGDTVKVNDMVLEIETAKSLVELPIPWAGTVKALLVEVGQTIDVGTPIISIDDGLGGDEAPAAAPSIPGEKAAPAEGALRGDPRRLRRQGRRHRPSCPQGHGCRPRRRPAPTETEQVAAAAPVAEPAAPAAACRVPGSGRPRRGRCRWPSQGEAARAQARQGPRHRPRRRSPRPGADGIITRDDVTNHASGAAVNGVAAQADSCRRRCRARPSAYAVRRG